MIDRKDGYLDRLEFQKLMEEGGLILIDLKTSWSGPVRSFSKEEVGPNISTWYQQYWITWAQG